MFSLLSSFEQQSKNAVPQKVSAESTSEWGPQEGEGASVGGHRDEIQPDDTTSKATQICRYEAQLDENEHSQQQREQQETIDGTVRSPSDQMERERNVRSSPSHKQDRQNLEGRIPNERRHWEIPEWQTRGEDEAEPKEWPARGTPSWRRRKERIFGTREAERKGKNGNKEICDQQWVAGCDNCQQESAEQGECEQQCCRQRSDYLVI